MQDGQEGEEEDVAEDPEEIVPLWPTPGSEYFRLLVGEAKEGRTMNTMSLFSRRDIGTV